MRARVCDPPPVSAVVLAILALLLVAAVVAVVAARRLPRESQLEIAREHPLEGITGVGVPAEAPPVVDRGPPLPVALVHGLFGFDKIARFRYFHRIAEHLESL